jgi:hypothetical protein
VWSCIFLNPIRCQHIFYFVQEEKEAGAKVNIKKKYKKKQTNK